MLLHGVGIRGCAFVRLSCWVAGRRVCARLPLVPPSLAARLVQTGTVVNVTWTPSAIIETVVLSFFTWWLVKYFAMANTANVYLVTVHLSW
jgi:hypothetical protein